MKSFKWQGAVEIEKELQTQNHNPLVANEGEHGVAKATQPSHCWKLEEAREVLKNLILKETTLVANE